jgi:hypothetical protein
MRPDNAGNLFPTFEPKAEISQQHKSDRAAYQATDECGASAHVMLPGMKQRIEITSSLTRIGHTIVRPARFG